MKQASNKKRVFVDSFFMTLGSIIEKILFFFITVMIARYLSKENYGEYVTALGLATFFAIFSNLNLGGSFIRSANLDRSRENEYYTAFLFIKSLISIISYSCLIISLSLMHYNRNTILLTVILGVVRVGTEFITGLYSLLEVKGKFKAISIYTALLSFSLFGGTLAVILFSGDYFHLIWIRLISVIVFLLFIFSYITKYYRLKFDYGRIRYFIKETAPFTGSFIFSSVLLNTGIIILPLLKGTVQAGIYQNAYIFIFAIAFLPANLLRVLVPFLYRYSIDTHRDKFQFSFDFYSKFFLILSCYLVIIFIFYSGNIIPLIFGDKYTESIPVLKIFSIAFPFAFSVAPTIILTIDRQRINSLFDFISMTFNIIFTFIFVYFYDVYGAAAAFVSTFFLIYAMSHIYLIRNNYISFRNTFFIILKLSVIFCIISFNTYYVVQNVFYLYSMIINSILYLLLVFWLIIKKDDFRILKEILGKK